MAKYEMFTSIDIGSYHLKGIVMRRKGDTWELLAYSSVRSRGIDGGEIKDAVA
ncbi:MAG: cell division protein FtsA, partial [Thermotoga sp.]